MKRALGVLVLVLLVGCAGLAPTAPTKDTPAGPATPAASSNATGNATANATGAATTTAPTDGAGTNGNESVTVSPDPAEDVQGWEQGVWYNETLPVTTSDGLNASERSLLLHRTMARVEVLRQVEFQYDVPIEVVSRESLGGDPTSNTGSGAARTFQNTRYEALFLLGEESNATEQATEDHTQNIQGYYFPSADTITIIVDGNASGPVRIREGVLAHELVHAVQFRQFEDDFRPPNGRDGNEAWRGLLEGEATVVTQEYLRGCGERWSCLRYGSDDESGDGNDTGYSPPPPGPKQALLLERGLPYVAGQAFVSDLVAEEGWAGMADVYGDPPSSTAQLLFPDAYADDARYVPQPSVQNESWSRVEYNGRTAGVELGAADIALLFAYTARDGEQGVVANASGDPESGLSVSEYRLSAVEGWDGDRFVVYQDDANRTGYIWATTWTSPAEAQEFADAYRDLLAYRGADRIAGQQGGAETVWRFPDSSRFAGTVTVRVDDTEVTIIHEPEQGALET